ncbi:plasmid replication protein, CyRepA1 family [Paraburkholderia phytofirmans]|uniref:plasmid replication protein, CyRepA1 family n=1 Tax=Paraburkholderia phytofirmans TaxID=261302 RepID=UPI0038B7D4E7
MERKFKCAVNRHIINKIQTPQDPEIFTTGFENGEFTIEELAAYINQGYAVTAQHKGRKRDANFTCSDLLMVDIDKGWTVEEARENPYIQQYAALLYTTANHTPEKHRFRVVFVLNRTIADAREMVAAYDGVVRKFGGDGSCKEPCRGFFGSLGSNPIIFGNVLPDNELDTLISSGSIKRVSDRVCCDSGNDLGARASQTSGDPLEKDQMVRLARGQGRTVLLKDLPKLTPIYCPKHFPENNPSAYVITNRHGVNGIRCRKCCLAYWPKDELRKKRLPYNFYEIEDLIKEADYYQTPANVYDPDEVGAPSNLVSNLLDELPGERTCHLFSKQYLSHFEPGIPLHEGITFIRSPKASGKTQWLEKIVLDCKAAGQSVLLVGHRQTLLQSMAKRLELTCYFYVEGSAIRNNQPDDHYAICVDSIGKLLNPMFRNYDVVIIDESEQVFSHLTSDTLKSKRRQCYQKLFHYLRAGKSIIVADADLGPITADAVCAATQSGTPYHFYLNQRKESRCDLHAYESEFHLQAELMDAVRAGGRHYITTNSKKKAEVLQEAIRYEFGESRKTMLVTSETTSQPEVQAFVNNIKTDILNYDVVVASPTLGTGVDITFENDAQLVDTVFGFFVPRVNTHFDIDQQLARVRHPKAIKVWVAPDRFGFETEPEAILSEVLDNAVLNDTIIGFHDDGRPLLDETYLNVYAQVTAMSRASKNNLRANFMELRRRNGWKVVSIEPDTNLMKDGKNRYKKASDVIDAKRIDEICMADKINPETYRELRGKRDMGRRLTRAEENSMRRQELEAFYREDISPELVVLDKNGQLRKQVRMMELYSLPFDRLSEGSKADREAGHFLSDTSADPLKKAMLYQLLSAAGLADESNLIKTGVVVSQHTLGDFAKVCDEYAVKIQELFDINVRTRDLHTKTMQKLSKVLELIGLKNAPPTREKVGNVTTYYYELDVGSLDLVRGIVERRAGEVVKPALMLDFHGRSSKTSMRELLAW